MFMVVNFNYDLNELQLVDYYHAIICGCNCVTKTSTSLWKCESCKVEIENFATKF